MLRRNGDGSGPRTPTARPEDQASCGGFPDIPCGASAGRQARRAADGAHGAVRAAPAGFT
ncbi:hypothetical protein C6Q14_05495 [Burkholderia ambifaria]|nr:hypothetical protein C6Q14_05495 [Burkholderia ambifaria]